MSCKTSVATGCFSTALLPDKEDSVILAESTLIPARRRDPMTICWLLLAFLDGRTCWPRI